MTRQKHLKHIIRTRMERTGESYVTARRHVMADAKDTSQPTGRGPTHLPGWNPGTSCLRMLLTHAGVRRPDGMPFSEALTMLIGGGLGMGVFQFRYEDDDASNFFMAGRHLWQDELRFVSEACARLGIEVLVQETGGRRRAAGQLEDAVTKYGPTMTWVDMAHLPYHGLPASWSGGGYHVIVVHAIEDGTAVVSDLTDEPIDVALDDLVEARARIRKFNNRILSVSSGRVPQNRLTKALEEGVRAGANALASGPNQNFTVGALDTLAQRMRGRDGKMSWDRVFPRGPHLWTALTWLYDCIEHYGTGGGLHRSTAAQGFAEAAEWTRRREWSDVAEQYDRLGKAWSDMAEAALPAGVPRLAEARALYQTKAERFLSDQADKGQLVRAVWDDLAALKPRSPDDFPIGESECTQLRDDLASRVARIADDERAVTETILSVR